MFFSVIEHNYFDKVLLIIDCSSTFHLPFRLDPTRFNKPACFRYLICISTARVDSLSCSASFGIVSVGVSLSNIKVCSNFFSEVSRSIPKLIYFARCNNGMIVRDHFIADFNNFFLDCINFIGRYAYWW